MSTIRLIAAILVIVTVGRRALAIDPGTATSCPTAIPLYRKTTSGCECAITNGYYDIKCHRVNAAQLDSMLTKVNHGAIGTLKISNSIVSRLPELDGMKASLTAFRCRNCRLTGIALSSSQLFDGFAELAMLDLSDNPLGFIDSRLVSRAFDLSTAEKIYVGLRNTKLERLPADMFSDKFQQKTGMIDLSGNAFGSSGYEIPDGVFGSECWSC